MLSIRNLHAGIEGREILKGFNLEVKAGEVHAIMGPNGSGKSTLAKVLTGDPHYVVTQGEVVFKGQSLLGLEPEDRALQGVFLAFQYPVEIPGVNNASFLRMAYNARRKAAGQKEADPLEFDELLREKIKVVEMEPSFIHRSVNHGFSGGEKKRNEIVQMAVLDPALAVLDETDSGLDIDALRIVASGVNRLRRADNAIILITHYQRLLNYIEPTFTHILSDGRIIDTSRGKALATELENFGYDAVKERIAKKA
ncbi:MAG TPA: Fe-S cluster assembly ATPase SufC [Candidatus Eisenbacteria bacterium]|jgi:Fe-S cluster assembly ATP-binding protein|nr:Fe-S cluster assembly ATPase SufC [Candidatus Eisenbacteria bacterium]